MSRSNDRERARPRLKIPRTPLEHALNAAALIGVVAGFAYLVVLYPDLPASVPVHADLGGKVDAWGGKGSSMALPVVALVLYLGLELVKLIPHHFNLPWPITAENAARQYQISRELIGWIQVELAWLFFTLEFLFVRAAQTSAATIGRWFMIVFIGAMFATLAIYIVKLARAR